MFSANFTKSCSGVCTVYVMFLSMLQGCAPQYLPRAAVGQVSRRKMTVRERERERELAGAGEKRRSVNLRRLGKFPAYNGVVLVKQGRGIPYGDQTEQKPNREERGENGRK